MAKLKPNPGKRDLAPWVSVSLPLTVGVGVGAGWGGAEVSFYIILS